MLNLDREARFDPAARRGFSRRVAAASRRGADRAARRIGWGAPAAAAHRRSPPQAPAVVGSARSGIQTGQFAGIRRRRALPDHGLRIRAGAGPMAARADSVAACLSRALAAAAAADGEVSAGQCLPARLCDAAYWSGRVAEPLHRNSPYSRGGLYFGPFASRGAAEAFLEPFLDLFRMRRCQIKIRRDPAFPGCIYSEMKMCLAPCFAGCTDEEYAARLRKCAAFLNSRGASYAGDLARERESASAALDFERAAGLHRRLEKWRPCAALMPELARSLDAARRRGAAARGGGKHGRCLRFAWRPHRGSFSAALRGIGQPAAFGRTNPARRPRTVRPRSCQIQCCRLKSARNEREGLVRGTGRPPGIAGALVLRSPSRGRDLFCRSQVHLALSAYSAGLFARSCASAGAPALGRPLLANVVASEIPRPAGTKNTTRRKQELRIPLPLRFACFDASFLGNL